jgi:protein gp37
MSNRFGRPWGAPVFMPERLAQPGQVKKPSTIFVCSMSDLFHENVGQGIRTEIFDVMRFCDWHTFMVLTKRPQNIPDRLDIPRNVWMGVTAENQARLNERLPYLHRMPGTRFVSIEPMLGPVTFCGHHVMPEWVIAGPENGPGARPCNPEWIANLAGECPCFFDKREPGSAGFIRREWPE